MRLFGYLLCAVVGLCSCARSGTEPFGLDADALGHPDETLSDGRNADQTWDNAMGVPDGTQEDLGPQNTDQQATDQAPQDQSGDTVCPDIPLADAELVDVPPVDASGDVPHDELELTPDDEVVDSLADASWLDATPADQLDGVGAADGSADGLPSDASDLSGPQDVVDAGGEETVQPADVADQTSDSTVDATDVDQSAVDLDTADGDVLSDVADGGPVTCADGCLAEELQSGPVCSWLDEDYASFCEAKCHYGAEICAGSQACPPIAHSGVCGDTCYAADLSGLGVGEAAPAFLCRNVNANSDGYLNPVTDVLLKERIWIAYFGSCT